MKIGAQLYTAHPHTGTLEGFDMTLRKVAEIGYPSVQVSGCCECDPAWLRDELKKYGLVCAMIHTNSERLVTEPEKVVKECEIYGCRHIGIGGMPVDMRGSVEGYERFCEKFIPVAKRLSDLGAKFMYHNHWFEFEKIGGKNVIDRLLEDFPADALDFTLDLGWAAFAGEDVLALIEKLSGRISRIHLKDFADMPDDRKIETPAYLRPIYEGKLDYDAYIKALEGAGTEYMLVEQDWCYGEDEFDCLKRSFDNVTGRFPNTK